MDDDYSEIKQYLIDVEKLLSENEKAIYRKRIKKIIERLDILEESPYSKA